MTEDEKRALAVALQCSGFACNAILGLAAVIGRLLPEDDQAHQLIQTLLRLSAAHMRNANRSLAALGHTGDGLSDLMENLTNALDAVFQTPNERARRN